MIERDQRGLSLKLPVGRFEGYYFDGNIVHSMPIHYIARKKALRSGIVDLTSGFSMSGAVSGYQELAHLGHELQKARRRAP